jgi:hypothetical protein
MTIPIAKRAHESTTPTIAMVTPSASTTGM